MRTRWVSGIELASGASGAVTSVPILPIGRFSTDNYPKLDLSEKVATELVRNFEERTLKHDIRIDIEHDFREAAGWIRALSIGEFTHPKSGETVPGIIAQVEWTPVGMRLLSEGQYRYVSAAFGDYRDEESGKRYRNVLMAVALTNDPAMKMLPALEVPTMLSAELSAAPVTVIDGIADTDQLAELMAGVADECSQRAHDMSEAEFRDWFEMRVAELPDQVSAVLGGTPHATREDVPEDMDATHVPSPPEGGTKDMSDELNEEAARLTAERDEALSRLAAIEAEQRDERIERVVSKLAAKGCTEPTISAFVALMTATDTTCIMLSADEDAQGVDVVEAVEEIAETLDTTVPVEAAGEQPNPDEGEDVPAELSETDARVAHLLRVSPEDMLAAQVAAAAQE